MTTIIAYCGMDCAQCEAYLATQADDGAKRIEVAQQWSVRYNTDIKPEQINCDGCSSDGRKFFFCADVCELRKCCSRKNLETCADCPEYPCQTLEAFFQLAPDVRAVLDALRK